jgi:hypothetical protein
MEHLWQLIKGFVLNHQQHAWLEYTFLYFLIAGIIATVVILIFIYIKVDKDIKKMDEEKRKRDKKILKFLSDKKNKTW